MGGFFQKELIFVLALSIGTLSVGFGLTYYGASLSTCVNDFVLDTDIKKSVFNAIAPICAAISSAFVNTAMQRFGRKYPTMASSGVVVFGWILIIATKRSYILYIQ